jgi:uncharacterized protein DUF6600
MCYARPMVLGRVLLGVLCGLSLITSTGRADESASARHGRLGAVSGAVQYRSPAGDWSAALVNEPVGTGVGVRSARGGRVELGIGDSLLALDGASELQILRLDSEAVQVALPRGRMFLHLAAESLAKTVEIDLAGGGVWLAAPGDYDIVAGDVHDPARIQVFGGHAALGGGLDDSVIAATAPDAFDVGAWRRASDAGDDTAHMPLGITGGDVLAANGDWASNPTYGDIWYPRDLPVDWMPYRYGSWRYLPPWGWTWIDAANWGFAPSHYGAWVRLDGRWAWAPGPSKDEPAYSPAAVGFLGTAGIGLSRPGNDGAAIGWFPLAPGESVDDGSAASSLNRRAASIVPRAVFAAGKPIQSALLELPEWRLDDAPVIFGELNIAPVGDGGTAFVAAAAPAPVEVARVAVVTPTEKPVAHPTPQVRARQLLIAHIHNILMRAAGKRSPPAAASTSHRWRAAAASLTGPHPAPSTIATASTHNRPHLAAGRGGAQFR